MTDDTGAFIMKLTDSVCDNLANWRIKSDLSLERRPDGTTRLKWDQIQITGDDKYNIIVNYIYKNKVVATDTTNIRLHKGETLTIVGLNGSTEIDVRYD